MTNKLRASVIIEAIKLFLLHPHRRELYVKGYRVIPFLSWGAAESIKNDLENPQEKQAHFKVPSRQGKRKKCYTNFFYCSTRLETIEKV